jgi:endoglucanase
MESLLTGTNPTGYCYVTGFGWKSPMHIHHRPSESDGITEPVPGFLAGGPNTVVMTDCPNAIRSTMPALSYVDELCSYSTNEIAINWNIPLAFLASALSNSCMGLPGSK